MPGSVKDLMNDVEKLDFDNFRIEHKNCKCSSTIGGKISVEFTPTGLGYCINCKCNVCGKEKDITDISSW